MRAKREDILPRDVRVVHRDEDLLVLDKPAGLPTTAPDGAPCLVRLAEALDPRAERLHPSSRLDADVTGLVTFARNKDATKALLAARRHGAYGRCYVALASPPPSGAAGDRGSWDWDVGIDARDKRLRVALDDDEEGKGVRDALTEWECAAQASGVAALRLRPRTGRTHQLRVHAARAGAPLLGDVAYGGAARLVLDDGRVVAARRVMLHCAWLSLPRFRERRGAPPLVLRAETPADMRETWVALGGDAPVLVP